MIAFENVIRRYTLGGEEWILGPLDFEVRQNEHIAILGTSGSGKSTLLHLLGALDTPTTGEIRVNNQTLSSMTEHEKNIYRQKTVGFVFQDFHLFPEFTVAENIALPLQIQNVSQSQALKKSEEMLKKVQLKGYQNHLPKELSGGQRQRVAIARALVHNPPILLADEPTGNLDEKTGEQIIALLKSLAKDQNMTMMLVTHDEKLAKKCARTLHIENGKLQK